MCLKLIEAYDIAGYCRIFVDEWLSRENTSIDNRKAIIEDFPRRRFPALIFYEDRLMMGFAEI